MAKPAQSDLLSIFHELKKELKVYEKGFIKARFDIEGKYDLWSGKPNVFVYDRVRNEMGFASLIVQSTYVGFYYMPIYCNPGVREKLSPNLLKLLRGKACFHIKSVDKELLKDVRQAMKIGYEGYRKNGWV